MRYAYPVNLEPEEDGGFVVSFPDVPEALTEGDTREEALAEAADALVVAMGGYGEDRRPIPEPSAAGDGQEIVALPMLTAAKLALYTAMRDQGVTNVALAERLGVSETIVRRLVHPGTTIPRSSAWSKRWRRWGSIWWWRPRDGATT